MWSLNPNPAPELAFVNVAEGITVIDFEGQGIQACMADLIETPIYGLKCLALSASYVAGTCSRFTSLGQGVLGDVLRE